MIPEASRSSVYDYCFDPRAAASTATTAAAGGGGSGYGVGGWRAWGKGAAPLEIAPGTEFGDIIVPTKDSARWGWGTACLYAVVRGVCRSSAGPACAQGPGVAFQRRICCCLQTWPAVSGT